MRGERIINGFMSLYICLGLLLRLDIEEEQYIGQISSEAGVRVTLHDQGTMAFPFEEGFSVSSGMSTSVGLQKVSDLKLKQEETFLTHVQRAYLAVHL